MKMIYDIPGFQSVISSHSAYNILTHLGQDRKSPASDGILVIKFMLTILPLEEYFLPKPKGIDRVVILI